MTDASRETVKFPDNHGIKAATVRVGHKLVELRTCLFRARDPNIDVLTGNRPSTKSGCSIAHLKASNPP
ncbi:MAG: hypothetical protein WCA38_17760 [Candidatus Acidiferrales bacterium]